MKKSFALPFLLLFMGKWLQAQNNIGLEFYSFRNEFAKDVPGTLEKIHNMGFRYVEGGSSYGMPLEEFKELLAKNKLEVVSLGAEFNELEKNPRAVVEKAKAYGSKWVVCFWIPHNGTDFTIDDVNKAISVFNSAGKILKEHGLSFCYHPHGYEFRAYNNETLFDHLVKNLDPAYANFEMDVFWIKHPGQDPVALLKKYPTRFKLMHLKDRKSGTEGNQNGQADDETNVVLGTGDVGIAEIMKAAKKLGIKYFFIEDESPRALEQVPQSLTFLKKLN